VNLMPVMDTSFLVDVLRGTDEVIQKMKELEDALGSFSSPLKF